MINEILSPAVICFGTALFGIALGFAFLQLQAKT